MKKITVTLNAEGKVEYETEGFVGHACQSEIHDSVPDFVNNLG